MLLVLPLSCTIDIHAAITDEDGHLQEKLLQLQASFKNGQFVPAPVTGTVC